MTKGRRAVAAPRILVVGDLMIDTIVKLELEDASVINVPLKKLSDEDQKYIRQRTH